MLGMQWCDSCRAPRFKIPAYGRDDVPRLCLVCDGDRISQRFVGANFAELRAALTEWILGPEEARDPHSPIPARLKEARRRFDSVIRTLEREEASHSEEWRFALREYREIRRRFADPAAPIRATLAQAESSTPIDLKVLHDFIERSKAADVKADAESPNPSSPEPRKPWGLFVKRPGQRD